jgi:hypothetical protein
MKKILYSLSIIIFSLSAQAYPIKVRTINKPFKSFSSMLLKDFDSAERELRIYLEDSLGCSKVRANLNIVKEGSVINRGMFNINLSADCDSSISGMQLDFDPSCTKTETALYLKYSKSGRIFNKSFVVNNSESCRE